MKNKTGRKGIFYTLAIVLLLIPLLLLASFHLMSSKTEIEDTTEKIRCDELHYFVEDIKIDLSRALSIFGRRAAIYAIDYVVETPGNPLMNYTFNCSSACNINCDKTLYPKTGAEAAIAELSLCGTLNGTNVTYMINHTVSEWTSRIQTRGEENNFRINITIKEIKVVPIDAWDFAVIIDDDLNVIDDTHLCYYAGRRMETTSNASITGLEDPLYTLGSGGLLMKYIYNCSIEVNQSGPPINGSAGSGTTGGTIIMDNRTDIPDPATYCSTNDASNTILVMTNGYGSCNQYQQSCYNIQTPDPHHFAGVIDYGGNSGQSFETKCNITIPWIRGTGDLGLQNGDCIYIKNGQVISGTNYLNINFTCYQESNATKYGSGCQNKSPDGPSFFDRLDGSYNLSEKYANQSREQFNNDQIGMETLVDYYDLLDHGITPNQNATNVDYLYWQNASGSNACGVCGQGAPPLRLDCAHAKIYKTDTGC